MSTVCLFPCRFIGQKLVYVIRKCLHFKCRTFFGLLVVTLVALFYWYHQYYTYPFGTNVTLCNNTQHDRFYNRRDNRRILLWTPFFGSDNWYLPRIGRAPFMDQNCPVSMCYITRDRRLIHESDAVLFHLSNFFQPTEPEELPESRHPEQVWIVASVEPSSKLPPSRFLSVFDNVFNWTASYRFGSDINLSYGRTNKLDKEHRRWDADDASNRPKKAIAAISNCFTPESTRLSNINSLQKYIDIDVFGRCGKPDPCKKMKGCFLEVMRLYKFYISHENTFCNGYITEKFWNALVAPVVPVVFGAHKEDYIRVAPPNSFIYANDFNSIEELGKYLNYLDKNQTAYAEYFKWRRDFDVESAARGITLMDTGLCELCEKLHFNGSLPRKTVSVSKLWNMDTNCWSDTFLNQLKERYIGIKTWLNPS